MTVQNDCFSRLITTSPFSSDRTLHASFQCSPLVLSCGRKRERDGQASDFWLSTHLASCFFRFDCVITFFVYMCLVAWLFRYFLCYCGMACSFVLTFLMKPFECRCKWVWVVWVLCVMSCIPNFSQLRFVLIIVNRMTGSATRHCKPWPRVSIIHFRCMETVVL